MTTILAAIETTPTFDRLRGLLGIVLILATAYLLSENRRAISRRVLFWGLALQWGFAFLVLYLPQGEVVLTHAGNFVKGVLDSGIEGAKFLFGEKLVAPDGPAGFVFAFRILPTVIFVGAFFAILYHVGVMQWLVKGFAVVMARLFGASGAESLNVAASLFIGQTEAPLTIRPYLSKLTKSELLTVMTSGMAHVSGGVMAGLFLVRRRAPAHPHGGHHDRARDDPPLQDADPRDRGPRDARVGEGPTGPGPTPTSSARRRGGRATASNWR